MACAGRGETSRAERGGRAAVGPSPKWRRTSPRSAHRGMADQICSGWVLRIL